MAPPPAIPAPKAPLLINRNFALLWIGQAISTIGDFVFTTTLVLWIATGIARNQPWAPLAVSGVTLAALVPTFFVGPLAGVFVDRWDKRRVMMRMDVLRAVLVGLLVFLPALGGLGTPGQLGLVYAVVVLATGCAQFFNPARLALVGDIVDAPLRPRASSLLFMTLSLGIVLGPALAAPLFFGLGVQGAFVVDAASFVASYLLLAAVRPAPSAPSGAAGAPRSVLGEFTAGLRFFAGNRVLRTILIATSITLFGSGAVNALGVFFLTDNLHSPAEWYGGLGAASGAGVLAGSFLAGPLAARLGVPRMFWLGTAAAGALILVYARMTSFGPAAVLLFLLGFPGAGINVAIGPMLLHVTPRELVGRVSAVLTPATSLAALVAVALAGYLDSTLLRGFQARLFGLAFGPVDTIYAVAGLLIGAAALYAARNLWGVTLLPPAPPALAARPADTSAGLPAGPPSA